MHLSLKMGSLGRRIPLFPIIPLVPLGLMILNLVALSSLFRRVGRLELFRVGPR